MHHLQGCLCKPRSMEPLTSIVHPSLLLAQKSSYLSPPEFAAPGHPMASPGGTLSVPPNTICATEYASRRPDLNTSSTLLNFPHTIVLYLKAPLMMPPSAPLALSLPHFPTPGQPPSPKLVIPSSRISRSYPKYLTRPANNPPQSRRPHVIPGLRRFLLHLQGFQNTPHHL